MTPHQRHLERIRRKQERYPNHCEPWTEYEDERLAEKFNRGESLAELVTHFERTPWAVSCRLEKLQLIPSAKLYARSNKHTRSYS